MENVADFELQPLTAADETDAVLFAMQAAEEAAAEAARRQQELDLVEAARAGNQAAFADLTRLHQEKLFKLAVRYVGTEQAQDVVTDAWMRAWQHLPQFVDQGDGIIPWVYTIAKRLGINAADKTRRQRARGAELPANPLDERYAGERPQISVFSKARYASSSAEDALIGRDDSEEAEREACSALLEGLSDDHRDILIEMYGAGRTIEEYAALRGIPKGTAFSRSKRARDSLAKLLSQRSSRPRYTEDDYADAA
jgi:RNA polymerase sigma-70 factor, ECF subfamily